MSRYFITGVVDVVWSGAVQFGSENHYFQLAEKELDHPKFVSLGQLENELAGSEGRGSEIYISREAKIALSEVKKKFPEATIKVFQPEKTVTSLPIMQNNPAFKYLLRPVIVLLFVMAGILLGAWVFHNLLLTLLTGVIILLASIWVIKTYDRWSLKQIEKFENG